VETGLQILGVSRRSLAWLSGIAGLAAYNWWVLVPFKHGLLRSPDELFSNLEVTGQPYAIVMQRADITAGLALLAAFLLAGPGRGRRREWLGMVVFALAGLIGGIFAQVCADGLDASCRAAERHFQLPLSEYLHDGAGVLEFAGITLVLWFAFRRTRGDRTVTALGYQILAGAALVAYPILGLSYLLNVFGAVMEAVFFVGFTLMVLLHLTEFLRVPAEPPALSSDHNSEMMEDNSVMVCSLAATRPSGRSSRCSPGWTAAASSSANMSTGRPGEPGGTRAHASGGSRSS
jgi:hypothetical protein